MTETAAFIFFIAMPIILIGWWLGGDKTAPRSRMTAVDNLPTAFAGVRELSDYVIETIEYNYWERWTNEERVSYAIKRVPSVDLRTIQRKR